MSAQVLPLRRRRVEAEDDRAPASDVELIERIARGERDALGDLFDRYAQPLASFLHRLGHTREHEVDDLVQDTFLAVSRSAAEFRGGASPKTWIFAVGANVARDRTRGASRFSAMRARLARWVSGTDARTPDRELAAAEDVAALRAAIAALPHDQRLAFVLCDVEEQPGVDVATTLGVPTGTLYRRLFEARKRVKAALEERAEGAS